jgi:hypothetical protein
VEHTPTLASLEETVSVQFCLIDDAYALYHSRVQNRDAEV